MQKPEAKRAYSVKQSRWDKPVHVSTYKTVFKMNTINYVQLIFACMTSSVIALGSLINSFEKYLPAFIKETFRYGKFSYTGKSSFIKPVKVPKSWFKHFYVFSSVLTIITLNLVVQVYIFDTEPPASLIEILDVCCGILRTPSSKNFFYATYRLY